MGMLQNHLEISDGNGDEFFCLQFGLTDHSSHSDNATSESNDWRLELLVSRDPYNGL